MQHAEKVAVLIADSYERKQLRLLLRAAGISSAGFDRTDDLASALRGGRRFELLVLAFPGHVQIARSELLGILGVISAPVPTLLLMQPQQVELAACVMQDANSDFLLGPYTEVEAYDRTRRLYLKNVTHLPEADRSAHWPSANQ